MRLLYSFIIDADPKFLVQARLLVASLLGSGVPACNIIANVTPASGDAGHALAKAFGIASTVTTPQVDGKFCNKIDQLLRLNDPDYDVLVLCDTDIAILERLDSVALPDAIRAKRVDLDNPPLGVLEALRPLFRVDATPEIVPCSCAPALTYRLNCNGGLMMLPRQFVWSLGQEWLNCAKWLHGERHRLVGWDVHIDQVSWAFAMLRLGYPFDELSIDYNFPTGFASKIPPSQYRSPSRPASSQRHR